MCVGGGGGGGGGGVIGQIPSVGGGGGYGYFLEPHIPDIYQHLTSSLSSIFMRWSAEFQTKFYDPRIIWICYSQFLFCEIVKKINDQ